MKILFSMIAIAMLGLGCCTTKPAGVCDFNSDGVVDDADIAIMNGAFNTTDLRFDVDGDGFVGGSDVSVCLGKFTNP